jgi:hypothetical protein
MPRTRNPFYGGYNDPALGQVAQNISTMILAQPSPYDIQAKQSRAAVDNARVGSLLASGAKDRAETSAIEARSRFLNDDQMFNTAFAEEGGDPQLDNATIRAQLAADPDLAARMNRRVGAYRASNTLPGRTNYHQLQQGMTEGADRRMGEMVLGGQVDPGRAAQSVAAREGKPQVAIQGDTRISPFLMDAPMQTTEIGQSKIGENAAQARKSDSGVKVDEARVTHLGAQTAHERAKTGEVGAKAKAEKAPKLAEVFTGKYDDKGMPIVERQPQAPGQRVLTPASHSPKAAKDEKAPKLPFNSGKVLDEEINAQFKGFENDLGPQDKAAIRAKASELYSATGNTTEAVRRAAADLGFGVEEKPGRFYGTNRSLKRPASNAPTQTAGGDELPAQARAKLKEGVVTRFGNGQGWTLQGGKPVKVD